MAFSSVNWFYSTDSYTAKHVRVVYRSVKVYRVVRSRPWGYVTLWVCPMEKLKALRRILMILTKSLMKLFNVFVELGS